MIMSFSRYKLIERKAKCLASIERNQDALLKFSTCKNEEICKITNNLENQKKNVSNTKETINKVGKIKSSQNLQAINPHLPAFSDAIELKYDEYRGRYGIAARDIEAGTVVLEEHPVGARLKRQYTITHCDQCFRKVSTLPVPCRTCSGVRYCSGVCRDTASSSYHKHECARDDYFEQIIAELNDGRDMGLNVHRLCYRIIAQQKLGFFKENTDNFTSSNIISGTTDAQGIFLPGDYQSMSNLVSHHERMDEATLLSILLSATAQLKMLQETNYFPEKTQSEKGFTNDERMMCRVIVHFRQVMKFNTHAIIEAILKDPLRPLLVDIRSIGCGVFPTLCLLNTSCDQNITKYHEGTKVIGVASKFIKKGEEVSDNYFPAAAFLDRTERRKWLREHYWFECECNACAQNLPLMKDLPEEPVRFVCEKCGNREITQDIVKCQDCDEAFDFSEKIQMANKIKTNITNYIKIYSSSDFSDNEKFSEKMKNEYKILQKTVAHPYQFLIVAEQQYLKSIKQVFGNRVFTNV